jgi:glycosyltransferase involved in cell wall biosynthesis
MIDVVIPTRVQPAALADLTAQIAETAGCAYRIVHTGNPRGSASANRNLGLSRSNGQMVAMVDDDVEFPPSSVGWLRVLVEALSRPSVVMVSAQLYHPDGRHAYMTGVQDCGNAPKDEGETVVPSRRLLTACCAFKPSGLTFDEGYVGSGFEDIDFCNQLAAARPDGVFLVCHEARAVHRNEAKHQRGIFWKRNEARYNMKWQGGEVTACRS